MKCLMTEYLWKKLQASTVFTQHSCGQKANTERNGISQLTSNFRNCGPHIWWILQWLFIFYDLNLHILLKLINTCVKWNFVTDARWALRCELLNPQKFKMLVHIGWKNWVITLPTDGLAPNSTRPAAGSALLSSYLILSNLLVINYRMKLQSLILNIFR